MADISLGLEWNTRKGRGGQPVNYSQNRHLTIFGPTRSGKGVCFEIPNLLRLTGVSIINIDPKGQNLAVTARWRSTVSTIVALDPLGQLGSLSVGFNPLASLDPASPRFFEEASSIAEALIRIEGNDPFFDESARGLVLALVMWEVRLAHAAGRMPLLENVRATLTGNLVAAANDMLASGDFQIASLAGRFREENRTNASIISTADTQTRWLLSAPMRADLAKNGIDFSILKKQPVTVYVVLPAEHLQTFSVWLRLVAACAMNALYRQGGSGLRTLFMLSEFAQLGRMETVAAALAQGAGYGVQLLPVLQDINQLRKIYGKDEANTFLGMSGATFAFTPNDGETAEWMSRRSSEITEPGLSASDDQNAAGAHESWRGEKRRFYAPDDLYNIPEFHGLVWFAGQAMPAPVYAPPYWGARYNPDLVGRYDSDPYHPEAGGMLRRGLRSWWRTQVGDFYSLFGANRDRPKRDPWPLQLANWVLTFLFAFVCLVIIVNMPASRVRAIEAFFYPILARLVPHQPPPLDPRHFHRYRPSN